MVDIEDDFFLNFFDFFLPQRHEGTKIFLFLIFLPRIHEFKEIGGMALYGRGG